MLPYPLGVSVMKIRTAVKKKMRHCSTNLEMSYFHQFRNDRFNSVPDQPS